MNCLTGHVAALTYYVCLWSLHVVYPVTRLMHWCLRDGVLYWSLHSVIELFYRLILSVINGRRWTRIVYPQILSQWEYTASQWEWISDHCNLISGTGVYLLPPIPIGLRSILIGYQSVLIGKRSVLIGYRSIIQSILLNNQLDVRY